MHKRTPVDDGNGDADLNSLLKSIPLWIPRRSINDRDQCNKSIHATSKNSNQSPELTSSVLKMEKISLPVNLKTLQQRAVF
jgi:hypothetical protein